MRAGQVEQIGAPLELYTRPNAPFVRDFLGQTIKLPGKVASVEGGRPRVDVGGRAIFEIGGMNHMKSAQAGHSCLVTIRPEEIVVAPDAASGPNALSATIRTLLFLGQQYEAVVDLKSGADLLIHLPRLMDWREGQAISLQCPAERLQVWDAE